MLTLLPTTICPSLEWEGEDSVGNKVRVRIGYEPSGDFDLHAEYFDEELDRWADCDWQGNRYQYRWAMEGFLAAHFSKPQPVNQVYGPAPASKFEVPA